MEYPCEIIQDLIPVYIRGEASEEAAEAIDRHVRECKECADYYCWMFDLMTQEAEETAQLEKWGILWVLRSALLWVRGNSRRVLKLLAAVLCLFAVAASLYGGWYGLTQVDCVLVTKEDFGVIRTLRMKDGDIFCEYYALYRSTFAHHYELSGGRVYFTAMRPLLDARADSPEEYKSGWIMDPSSVWDPSRQEYISVEAIYLGNPEDAILVWDPGMELPMATAAEEREIDQRAVIF